MSKEKSPFEYGGYWLERDSKSPNWQRAWYDERAGRVRTRTLKTSDLGEAKKLLVAHRQIRPTSALSPDHVLISAVTANYITLHAEKKGFASDVRAPLSRIVDHMDNIVKGIAKVSDLTRTNQRKLIHRLKEENGLKNNNIKHHLDYLRAAMNFAITPQIINEDGEQTEVLLLERFPMIFAKMKEVEETLKISEPTMHKTFVPTYREMARWIDGLPDEVSFRYVIVALNTWARAQAIIDLNLDHVDFQDGIVQLNPYGRAQTKKRRPKILLTDNLRGWLNHWNEFHPLGEDRDPEAIKTKFYRYNKRSKLEGMTRTSIRHFMNRNARDVQFGNKKIKVDREKRRAWLGHVHGDTTDHYEGFDIEYMEEAKIATDYIIRKIDKYMKVRSLFTPETHLKVIPIKKEK